MGEQAWLKKFPLEFVDRLCILSVSLSCLFKHVELVVIKKLKGLLRGVTLNCTYIGVSTEVCHNICGMLTA